MISSDHALAPMLRKLSRWSVLDKQDQQAILALPHETRTIGKGNYIVRDGDQPTRSCVLLSGFAYRHKLVGNGGRQILSVHMSGDVVDLQNSLLRIADHDVQALTEAVVAFIPAGAIRELAFSRPAVGMAMWYDTLVDGSVHREWTANVGRRDSRTRMAHLLCEFGVRLHDAGLGSLCSYEMPMTQEQLADCTGLTPVHVNRTLKSFDREGLTQRTLRSVAIDDWEALAKVGDFDTRYLHLADKQEFA
ncbi:MAG TPA: Crp/Fnr family transcriptional regulator [Allosphingosinicella sp.]|jgi:CRP-like cAMP-binding protein